jgi:hypothetical protein
MIDNSKKASNAAKSGWCRAAVGDDPDPVEAHTRVSTGLIRIDGGVRRRQA